MNNTKNIFKEVNNQELDEINEESGPLDYIDNHLADYFADEELMLLPDNEAEAGDIPVDIYRIKPSSDRDCNILITCGMSAVAMEIPKEDETEPEFVELAIILPASWDFSPEGLDNENNFWPIRLLRYFAKFHNRNQTWIGKFHALTNGDPPCQLAANNNFVGAIILPSITLPPDFTRIQMNSGDLYIYSLFPLYAEEIEAVVEHGPDYLLEKFDQFAINETIDISRKNTCK